MDILVWAAGIIVAIVVVIFVIMYNALVTLKNNVSKAWANIDVLLEQRHDELGKLVDTVAGYKKYEQTILTQLTSLRTAWMNAPKDDVQARIDASNQITQALKTIFATTENYPDLKANTSFMQLQDRISQLETEIAGRREFYNDSVNQYNIKINVIPYNIFSGMLGYKPMPLFQVPEEAKEDVKINLQ
jgi:LemA protein